MYVVQLLTHSDTHFPLKVVFLFQLRPPDWQESLLFGGKALYKQPFRGFGWNMGTLGWKQKHSWTLK